MMKDHMKTAVTLFLITLISGFLLGGVYELTKEPIAEANRAALYAAYEELVPGGAEYETDDALVQKANEALSAQGVNVSVNGAVTSKDASGRVLGYIVDVTSHEGYGGDIQLTVGFREENGALKSSGISFLSIAETAGLGMNAQNPEFKDQFTGKPAEQLALTKDTAGELEISAMSGATVTSSAILEAVNAASYTIGLKLDGTM